MDKGPINWSAADIKGTGVACEYFWLRPGKYVSSESSACAGLQFVTVVIFTKEWCRYFVTSPALKNPL